MAALAAAPLRVAGLCKASLPVRAARPQRVVLRAAASTQDVQVRRGPLPCSSPPPADPPSLQQLAAACYIGRPRPDSAAAPCGDVRRRPS